jgi:hypothetical protein
VSHIQVVVVDGHTEFLHSNYVSHVLQVLLAWLLLFCIEVVLFKVLPGGVSTQELLLIICCSLFNHSLLHCIGIGHTGHVIRCASLKQVMAAWLVRLLI